ncbi:hypothetical protein BH23GEM7_BH23GEM7_11920 [soil metagenome]|nr:type VI secretion system protein TssA [Gemmatimonadota bacterium]
MPLRDDLLTPIAGENPAGVELRYDPVFDKIKEARREDLDVPAGDWEAPRKIADWPQVIRLSSETIATRSKDLQLAVWLTEALLWREGFSGLRNGLELIRDLLAEFWEQLYPELEDGDAEMRAAPLDWLGSKLGVSIRLQPLNAHGHTYLQYRESQSIPTEAEAEAEYEDTKRTARAAAIQQGRITPEAFEQGFAATPKEWYKLLVDEIARSLDAIVELDRVGEERFGADAPSYRTLREALQEVQRAAEQLLARKLQADPDPVAESAQSDGAVDVGSGTGHEPTLGVPALAGSGSVGGAAAGAAVPAGSGAITPMPTSREDAAARIAAAARYLRDTVPLDPASYLLLRGFRWGELRAGSGDLDPTLLAAPPTDVRVHLKQQLLDGRWDELLNAAEEVMAAPYGRGWLDLQRYVLTACEGLGSEYDAVAAAVRGALRALLQDFPELPELTLMDDSPTSNRETGAWLRAEGLLGGADASGDGSTVPFEGGRPARGRLPEDRAIERVRAGEPQKGIEILIQEAAQRDSARARFLLRTRAAGIMLEIGMANVALPILRELVEQVEKYQLEEWEAGNVVAESLGLFYQCLGQVDADNPTREELYLRICRLDPLRAIRLVSTAGNGAADEYGQGG